MRMRVQTPSGRIILTLPEANSSLSEDELTYGHLVGAIERQCGLNIRSISFGYPPTRIELADDIPLAASGIRFDKQSLIVEPIVEPKKETAKASAGPEDEPKLSLAKGKESKSKAAQIATSVSVPVEIGTMVVRPMPDDNSCLFHAIATATLSGAALSVVDSGRTSIDVESLRARVARRIDPSMDGADDGAGPPQDAGETPIWRTEAALGKKPEEYARWIMLPESWGSAIEIMLLADELGVEMCVVNVERPESRVWYKPSVWAQEDEEDRLAGRPAGCRDEGRKRCFLVFSGIHYDVLAVRLPGSTDDGESIMLFPIGDESYPVAASEIAGQLLAKNYYTNTSTFQIECKVCKWRGKGENEAREHAKKTSHYEFGEAKSR